MKHLIKYLFPISYFLLPVSSFSQTNLVPNPSFEDSVACPFFSGQINYATSWMNPTAASPDYMNACNTGQFGVPTNYIGTQNAHTGNAYALIVTYCFCPGPSTSNGAREYIQVPLNSILLQGETYCVEFYVSLANGQATEYAVNNLGAYFSSTAVSSNSWNYLPYVPQVVNPSSNSLTNAGVWTKVSGQFIAQGGEHYLTIGNFNDNALSDTVFIKPANPSNKESDYYIDDISVIHIDAGAGNDTAICNGGSVLLGRPAKAWLTYSWQPATGLNNTTIAQPIASPTVTTTYYLTATLNGSCAKEDTVTVTVVNANAGTDTTLCYGSSTIIGTAGVTGVNYTWQPITGLNNAAIAQPIATPNLTTTYTVTAAANGCSKTDNVNITILPLLAVNAGTDVTILLGTNTILTASAIAGASFNWSPPTYLSCDTCATTVASPTNTTTYVLTASLNSCSTTDTVTVYVDTDCGELFVPNVFSPNGDNQNDILKVYGNCISSIDLLIFDRWGEQVFESTNLNIGWDGTYQGKFLDEAVFVYTLTATVNGVKVVKKGNVSIVK